MNLSIFAQIMKIDYFQTRVSKNRHVKIRDVMNELLRTNIVLQNAFIISTLSIRLFSGIMLVILSRILHLKYCLYLEACC